MKWQAKIQLLMKVAVLRPKKAAVLQLKMAPLKKALLKKKLLNKLQLPRTDNSADSDEVAVGRFVFYPSYR